MSPANERYEWMDEMGGVEPTSMSARIHHQTAQRQSNSSGSRRIDFVTFWQFDAPALLRSIDWVAVVVDALMGVCAAAVVVGAIGMVVTAFHLQVPDLTHVVERLGQPN